jgi:hypothetical protein
MKMSDEVGVPGASTGQGSAIEPYGLDAFIEELRGWTSRGLPAATTLRALTPAFKRLLANRSFLEQALGGVRAIGDEARLFHDEQRGFVVLARGIATGPKEQGVSHAASPHDHGPLWALYGLYRGSARMQRYEPDASRTDPPFPGLRLTSDVLAHAGDVDAIAPHHMHLPLFLEGGKSTVIVVYSGVLEAVTRRGYVRSRGVVEFQGVFPPEGAPGDAGPSIAEANDAGVARH